MESERSKSTLGPVMSLPWVDAMRAGPGVTHLFFPGAQRGTVGAQEMHVEAERPTALTGLRVLPGADVL